MPENLEQKLELIKDAKLFCVKDLGIRKNPSFEIVDNNLKHVYCFSATKKDGKIRGAMIHYRSFYNKDELELYRSKYSEDKYDICIREVEAIGSKSMLISKDLIESSEYRSLYVIFHENYHIHFGLNNTKISRVIEEPICDYLGLEATEKYVEKNHIDYLNAVKSRKAQLYQRHQLTNDIITEYNKKPQNKTYPEGQILQNIKTLENYLKMPLIQADNSINKAILQEVYIYSKHSHDVVRILGSISSQICLKKIVEYNRPINTLTDLRKAVK